MADESVEQAVVRAVQQAYDAWALEHPSLAAVIDRITLTERAIESLRDSNEFRQAVQAYHESQSEFNLLSKLIDLAGPIVASILAG